MKALPDEFSKYGVTFRRLRLEHIEMLRNWRNDPKISRWMGTQQYIEPEAQVAWFESIKDRDDAFYFIVYVGEDPVGYWNIKNIDWDKKIGEPGVIAYAEDRYDTSLAYRMAFCPGDLWFDDMGMECFIIHVLRTNVRARRFNISLGYVIKTDQEQEDTQAFTLTEQQYIERRDKIMRYIDHIDELLKYK